MKSFTPEIAWHNRDPIYSVDIQDSTEKLESGQAWYRVATAGVDSHVVIWKVTLASHENHLGASVLADITRHDTAVNVLRFAPSKAGNLLASADGGVIYIWKLQAPVTAPVVPVVTTPVVEVEKEVEIMEIDVENPPPKPPKARPVLITLSKPKTEMESRPDLFGEENVVNIEQWTYYKLLRGHLEDIVDLCWSSDGKKLISGSVDNTAYVWDVEKGQKLEILTGHKSWVQGVTYDPCNGYLATLSSDRNLRIFHAQTKKQIYRIEKGTLPYEGVQKKTRLFYDYTLQSFCRRLTFSPGGEILLVPSGVLETSTGEKSENAAEGDVAGESTIINTVYLFLRNNISRPAAYYNCLDKFSTAVRCCPTRFCLREGVTNPFPFPYRIVFAIATQDSILFFDTQQQVPFAYVTDIHYSRLTDITWSRDGRLLMVSSTDGYCTFVTFAEGEIGVPYEGPVYASL